MSIEKIERELLEGLGKTSEIDRYFGWEDRYRDNAANPRCDRQLITACSPENIRALLDELSRLREERDKYKTALTLTPMAKRLVELPDFMVALSEWGCTEPSEQAASIYDFLNSLVGLKQYLDEARS